MKAAIHVVPQVGNPASVTVRLEGELVLGSLSPLKVELDNLIRQVTVMRIEIRNAPKLDVAGLQLLLATRRSLQVHKVAFHFDIQLPKEADLLWKHAGVDSLAALLNQPSS